jgi:ATP-dependent protease ClpP protease subunit
VKIYSILLVTGFIFLNSTAFAAKNNNDGVYFKDGKIHYEGDITQGKNKKFFDLSKKSQTHDIYINSGGGDIEQGMALGDFIYNKEMNVYITHYCFSSCANYVFTSGKNKFISEHALIGYHGGAYSFTIDQFLISEENYLKRKLTKQEVIDYTKKYSDYINRIKVEQDDFYSKRHINKKIASLGANAYPNVDITYDLAYYTILDFNRLGVHNIHVVGGGSWTPEDHGNLIVINKNYEPSDKDKDKLKLIVLDLNDLGNN